MRGASPGCLPLVDANAGSVQPSQPLARLLGKTQKMAPHICHICLGQHEQHTDTVGVRDRVASAGIWAGGGGGVCFLLSPATLATPRPIFSRDRMRVAAAVSLFIQTVILVFRCFTARLSLLRSDGRTDKARIESFRAAAESSIDWFDLRHVIIFFNQLA